MNIRKLAIIAQPDRVLDYIGLAIRHGFEPVNSISGYLCPEDIDQSDCVYFPAGWASDSYLLQLVNRSLDQNIPAISIQQLGTNQKTIHYLHDTVTITYLTHCPYCLNQYTNQGTIHVSDNLEYINFKNFYCLTCNKKSTPIHHIKRSIYAMDC